MQSLRVGKRHYCDLCCVYVAIACARMFVPDKVYWRLVLIARKFCLVTISVMLNSAPMFQAR